MTSKGNLKPSNTINTGDQSGHRRDGSDHAHLKTTDVDNKDTQITPHYELSKPCTEKKHWLDYAVFVAAFIAALGGIAAAGFTWKQVWIAEDTSKKQLRAYLSVRVPPSALQNFGEGKTAHIQGIIDNIGETPAYKAAWMSGINVSENTMKIRFAYNDCNTIMSQADIAEWFIAKQPAFPDKDRSVPFSKKEVDDIEAGKAAVYFNGRVCYLDIFEEVQAVDFCIYWDWDRNKNRLRSEGTYCRHSNGPPEKKSTY